MVAPTPLRDRSSGSREERMASTSYERLRKEAEVRRIADQLQDLTETSAWTEVLAPELARLREQYTTQLIDTTLGAGIPHFPEGDPVSAQVLAARIRSIDWLFSKVETILRAGEVASARMSDALPHMPSGSVV